MKKNKLNLILISCCCVCILTGCSINDLKTKKYVEIPGTAYSQIEKKDTKFNEASEVGEVDMTIEEESIKEKQLFAINGPIEEVNFNIPNNWYESTNGKKKELTATKNPDIDLDSSWINKSFCDETGLYRMYIYVVPSNDFGDNLLKCLSFTKESDKKIRKNMGAYPNVLDIQYGTATIEDNSLDYAWKTYSGTTKNSKNLMVDVSYTRGVCFLNEQTIIFSLSVTANAKEVDNQQLVENFFLSVVDNN